MATRVDEAAVFGSGLAAVLTLTLGDGDWIALNSVIGATLVGLVVGFSEPEPISLKGMARRLRLGLICRSAARASILGLCWSIAFAWPIQAAGAAESGPIRWASTCDATSCSDSAITTSALWLVWLSCSIAALGLANRNHLLAFATKHHRRSGDH